MNLGVIRATYTRPRAPEPETTADRLLDVLVDHGASTPTVVFFDEFSSIRRVDGAAGLLRTKLQMRLVAAGQPLFGRAAELLELSRSSARTAATGSSRPASSSPKATAPTRSWIPCTRTGSLTASRSELSACRRAGFVPVLLAVRGD
ncbi:MAG: hypothetical protein KY452_02645 [Actinobacteria bacterium]|nr:hypothetical protein [Actinomycetota bacterium]